VELAAGGSRPDFETGFWNSFGKDEIDKEEPDSEGYSCCALREKNENGDPTIGPKTPNKLAGSGSKSGEGESPEDGCRARLMMSGSQTKESTTAHPTLGWSKETTTTKNNSPINPRKWNIEV